MTPPVRTLPELVARMRRALRAGVRADIPWERLPVAQVELLQSVHDEPGMRVRDLAARHRLAPNTVSALVQQMVRAGLVERARDPQDRRAVAIRPTAQGRQLLAKWAAANAGRIDAALDQLPAGDRRAIVAALPALNRLVALLEQAAAERGDGPAERPATR